MKKAFAPIIPGLEINGEPAPYPVVNERAVRATAGIMFVIAISTFWYIKLTGNYGVMNVIVPLFWLEFFLKAVWGPAWSIFGIFGRWLVRKQKPEYVGAIQKRFAWTLGLMMASSMVIISLLLEIRGILPMAICGTCMFLMWLESACGICVGCKIYQFLVKKNFIMKAEYAPACPGGACSISRGI